MADILRQVASDALASDDPRVRTMAIMHGDCPPKGPRLHQVGADHYAKTLATAWQWIHLPRPVDEAKHGPWPGAGPIRNQAMVDECVKYMQRGTIVVCRAFSMPCSKHRTLPSHDSHGTADCAARARAADIPTEIIRLAE